MPHTPRAQSLQELRHIKKALQVQRLLQQQQQAREQEKQRLLAEQNQAFAAAVGKVSPLRGDHAQRVQPQREPLSPRPRQRERDQAAVMQEALSDDFDVFSLMETDEQLSFSQPNIGDDVLRDLRKGRWSIQQHLDLHGLRKDDARHALSDFMNHCYKSGIRCVRVVTGKGLGSYNREPVLKKQVPKWLSQKKEVLAFVQARPQEGGAGALIVLLAGRKHAGKMP